MEMNKNLLLRLNDETIKKIDEIIEKKEGLYPTRTQVIRSAIHFLYNKEVNKK